MTPSIITGAFAGANITPAGALAAQHAKQAAPGTANN